MTTIKNPKNETPGYVSLSQLHSLKSASFFEELPEHATREPKQEQVANLRNAVTINPETKIVGPFPPLSVVNTDDGYFVLDGYHRWIAIEQYLKMAVLGLVDNDELKPLETARALRQPLDEILQKQLEELRSTVKVPVTVGVYKDIKAVAIFCLKVNFTHGLRPEGKAKTLMAVEYYNLTRDTDNAPSQSEVARIFGIGRSVLNEYLREKKMGIDTPKVQESGDGGASSEEKSEETAEEKFCAKLVAALKLLDKVDDLTTYIQQMKQVLSATQISNLVNLASEKTGKHTVQPVEKPAKRVASSKSKTPVTHDSKDSQVPVQEGIA